MPTDDTTPVADESVPRMSANRWCRWLSRPSTKRPSFRKTSTVLCDYMRSLEHKYDWELRGRQRWIARTTRARWPRDLPPGSAQRAFVLDHVVNFGLGQALKFAFNECHGGDIIVTVDMDLSYSAPTTSNALIDTMRQDTGQGCAWPRCYMPKVARSKTCLSSASC